MESTSAYFPHRGSNWRQPNAQGYFKAQLTQLATQLAHAARLRGDAQTKCLQGVGLNALAYAMQPSL
eukprot:4320813-Pleurochrysis_carterae.AAC.1